MKNIAASAFDTKAVCQKDLKMGSAEAADHPHRAYEAARVTPGAPVQKGPRSAG